MALIPAVRHIGRRNSRAHPARASRSPARLVLSTGPIRHRRPAGTRGVRTKPHQPDHRVDVRAGPLQLSSGDRSPGARAPHRRSIRHPPVRRYRGNLLVPRIGQSPARPDLPRPRAPGLRDLCCQRLRSVHGRPECGARVPLHAGTLFRHTPPGRARRDERQRLAQSSGRQRVQVLQPAGRPGCPADRSGDGLLHERGGGDPPHPV